MPKEEKETKAPAQSTKTKVLTKYMRARTVMQRNYPQLNNRTILQAVDDWTKRWNGYISAPSELLDSDQSRIFLNFTRNQIIDYLANFALRRPKTKVKAVNKKTGSNDPKFSSVCNDLLDFSANEENGDAKFLANSLEGAVKGTVVAYEGYLKDTQKMKVPKSFDSETGKIKAVEEDKVVYDNAYQEIVPIEDFLIANPYQPNIQKQPFVIWRKITTYDEAACEFADYKDWDKVEKGNYSMGQDGELTFYRSALASDLTEDGVEVLRFYEKYSNTHVVMVNGIVLYDGPIPRKDGKYPFAKGIFEPFDNEFFWGAGFPNKIMGEQDLINTFWNMMVDKTYGSLLPFGLSSDLDDWIEDDTLSLNRIRKVGDINKWKFDTLPGVNAGEQAMLQTAMNFARENSGIVGGGPAMTPRGGKLNVRQVLLQQQEAMKKIGFHVSFMEDMEKDRSDLRLATIFQFYAIPKIEKITGKRGKELEQLFYRDVRLNSVRLSDGKVGNKYIKLVDSPKTPDERQTLADDLSVMEAMGEVNGTPTEALAVAVDTFSDYNYSVQVIKASSFEENAALDQASRMEFANWRLPLVQVAPADSAKIVEWVEESFDIDQDQFKPEAQANPMQMMMNPMQPPQGTNPLQEVQPSSMGTLGNLLG